MVNKVGCTCERVRRSSEQSDDDGCMARLRCSSVLGKKRRRAAVVPEGFRGRDPLKHHDRVLQPARPLPRTAEEVIAKLQPGRQREGRAEMHREVGVEVGGGGGFVREDLERPWLLLLARAREGQILPRQRILKDARGELRNLGERGGAGCKG